MAVLSISLFLANTQISTLSRVDFNLVDDISHNTTDAGFNTSHHITCIAVVAAVASGFFRIEYGKFFG